MIGMETENKPDLLVVISGMLATLGVRKNLKGYPYLREAIRLVVCDFSSINNVVKLYETVADTFKTTATTATVNIRNAIAVSYNEVKPETMENVIGFIFNGKPSNSEFIAAVADKIILTKAV